MIDPKQLLPDDLASCVRDEIKRNLVGGGADERYSLELIHRAVVNQDADAWAALYAQFAPLIWSWLARQAHGREALLFEGSDALINAVFAKLWLALRAGTQRFTSVGAFLSYLRMCSSSVLMDWWRDSPAYLHLRAGDGELPGVPATDGLAGDSGELVSLEEVPAASNDPAAEVVACLAFQELHAIIQHELRGEDERAVVLLSLLCGYPPRDISRRRPDLFPTVEDVYRVKRNVIDRLRRNQCLHAYLPVRAAGGEAGRPQPSGETGGEQARRQQEQEAARRSLLTLLEQRALSEARNHLLGVVERQTLRIAEQIDSCAGDGIRYNKRLTFCGKQRCRKCREGTGHGPYWYAYKCVNGRTVRTYLGKAPPQ